MIKRMTKRERRKEKRKRTGVAGRRKKGINGALQDERTRIMVVIRL